LTKYGNAMEGNTSAGGDVKQWIWGLNHSDTTQTTKSRVDILLTNFNIQLSVSNDFNQYEKANLG
jgi:hypothetical protein